MRDIKFSCMWYDGASWMDLRYTLEELENGDHWDALADLPLLKKFKLKHKRQFTGLTDKNGVEIYEGDIVRSFNDYWDGCKHLDLICRYDESEWVFGDYPWCEVGSEKCEVIGNIYENPELLED